MGFDTYLSDPFWILHLHDIINLHVFTQGSLLSGALMMMTNSLEMRNGEQVQVLTTTSSDANDGGDVIITLSSANTAQAPVLETDILAANGVVHRIGTILLPVWYDRNLFQLAVVLVDVWDDVNVSTDLMLMAVVQGGLTISGNELTAFVPTDAAWQEVEPETLEFYRDPANMEALIELLEGHLVETVYPSVGAKDGDVLTTVAGTQIIVSVLPDNSTVMFNDAVLDPRSDLLASNGLAHGINKVWLLPTTLSPTGSNNDVLPQRKHPSLSPTRITDSPFGTAYGGPNDSSNGNDHSNRADRSER